MTERLGPPSLIHAFTEAARSAGEFTAMALMYRRLREIAPKGDGRPVLVVPGLGAGDLTTAPLRGFLNDIGYAAYGWNAGVNTGPAARILARLDAREEDILDRHDGQKLTWIGHSLGGIYSREKGRGNPSKVSQVITLGSPFGAGLHPGSAIPLVRKAFALMNGKDHPFLTDETLAQLSLTPPPVPTTSIYSRSDGVVHWRTCLNPVAKRTENIEVSGSHCGLVFNPAAFLVVADRLAQDVGSTPKNWRPFERLKHSTFPFFRRGYPIAIPE